MTAPARTVLDLADVLTERDFEQAFDEAVICGAATEAQIAAVLDRSPGRRGVPAVRSLMTREFSARVRSELEADFLAAVRQAQLPVPEVNVRFAGYRLDFFWRALMLAVETDGWRYHGQRRRPERDARRDERLGLAGVLVARVSYRQLADELLATIARVANLLGKLEAMHARPAPDYLRAV